ncbi:hypothetical protein IB267_26985 [Ensifer sp. ENS09]|uniref:hypothetical protein n=1 Tax=Ensifer sp. ENS09 TaxID=2769263 RepID=UPI00177C0129|nr:hypothetical protein [Ensifer sp. ENS09]MBD9652010.1 hypothetical protein [Ensifer sp. ENS09]
MNRSQLESMRDRYTRQMGEAQSMIEYIREHRFVFKDQSDDRSDEEIMAEDIASHQHLIDKYALYIRRLNERLAEGS